MTIQRFTILLFTLAMVSHCSGQFTTVLASSSCACDGAFVFTNPSAGVATYTLTDQDGNQLSQQTNALGIFNAAGLCPQIYLVEVNMAGSIEYFVTNILSPALDAGDADEVTICTTDGTVQLNTLVNGITAGGVWTNPAGNTISQSMSAATALAGLYVYTIMNSGCEVTTGLYINISTNANAGLSTTYVICDTYQPFEMIVFMAGGPDLNGDWFDTMGNPMDGWFDPATMNSNSYLYSIDTVPGCDPVFAVMTIDENQTPDAGVDASVLVCDDGLPFDMADYLGGTPDAGGQWFDSNNNPVPTIFNPLTMPEGIYRYHVDGQVPCLDHNAYLTITFTNSNPSGTNASYSVCENGGIINMLFALEGNPQPGGIWTNSSGTVVDNIFNPANEPAGIYNYYVPNVGCQPSNAQLTIVVETLTDAGPDNALTLCENALNFNLCGLLGAGANAGGIWTNSLSQTVTPLQVFNVAGTFTFTYTVTGNICPDNEASFEITVDEPVMAPGNTAFTICEDAQPVDLNDLYSISGLLFTNSSGQVVSNEFDPATNASAIFLATLSSNNTCPDGISEINITVENFAFANGAFSVDVCSSLQTFDLNTTNAAINFGNGQWTDMNAMPVSNLVLLDIEGQAGFTFASEGEQMCASSFWHVTLTVFVPNEAGTDTSVVFCTTDDASALTVLMPSASSGAGSWNYEGIPFTSSVFNPQTDNAGTYYYEIPANGPCPADIAELEVVLQNGIDYSAGPDLSQCSGISPIAIGQDNNAGFTYIWQPAQDLNDATVPLPLLSIENNTAIPIEYEYTVIVSDGVCLAHDTVVVTLYPLPVPGLADTYEMCNDDQLTLSTTATGMYQWEPGNYFPDQTAAVQIISPDAAVNIYLTVTNNWNCAATDTALITVNPMPQPVFDIESIAACPPVLVELALSAASTYCDNITWFIAGIGTFTDPSVSMSLSTAGVYSATVNISTNEGCTVLLQPDFTIEVFDQPSAAFTWSPYFLTTLDATAYFENMSDGATDYFWMFMHTDTSTAENPVYEFPHDEPANYDVCLIAKNQHGCTDSICEIIHLDNEYIFYAPNTFTPDDDGMNDVFIPIMQGFDESTYSLQVFDRWGDNVFASTDAEQPWTGNVHGGSYYAQPDVYLWQVKVKDREKAEYRVFQGHITLIR
ncbi:MAG: gliding motility-associated C-terminal domain-containing protein [Flavobacteriales bacterium]